MATKGRFARALFGARLILILSDIGAIHAGYIGCKISSSICYEDEACIDDDLFGNCQKYDEPKDYHRFELGKISLKILEGEILGLIDKGYTWQNEYTQCILGGVLEAFREGESFDRQYCSEIEEGYSDTNTPDIISTLSKYLRQGKVPTLSQEIAVPSEGGDQDPWRDKKDELIKIHKYFARKDDDEKRSYGEGYDTDDSYSYQRDPQSEDDQEVEEAYRDLLGEMSPEELKTLDNYLTYIEKNPSVLEESLIRNEPPYEDNNPEEDPIWGDVRDEPSNDDADKQENKYSANKRADQDSLESLSPEEAKLLGDLLAGKVSVDKLPDDKIRRLNKYVSALLEALGPADFESWANQLPENANEASMKRMRDKKIPPMLKKEQPNDDLELLPQGHSKVGVQVKKSADILDRDGGIPNAAKDPPPTSPGLSVLSPNYVNIKVSPSFVSHRDGIQFLTTLAKLLKLSQQDFSEFEFSEDLTEVNFRVEPNLQHINGTVVASSAEKFADALKNRTNHEVTGAWIGRGNILSVEEHEQNNPKYYVLTFVLCGVIAATVIGVILIYVVRRHSRAINKLSQLTDNGTGNEASADYQDLCRQRMQSKSSEKPEPIHASAGRVASVSSQEAAVRSPSSRSSTSSWSEEPASSSMDITTGHIVLSYMEDHLKNKDRLDQEWEGLCAYEAEPNSASVAGDSSNMRRNRYSDILPYDHSRVVLSKPSNVSGSDFINASSITDHDPRNPAYIASQGPLPHTVADFWQMVWEQGSVVIVNLTKLTENGVAMCHRYWPEEGSDLYHIYEVHLVSEHIWCDDYLVRSFYLKNLQTNETRTVTQFHFLTWADLGVPSSVKALLDFRRKVNKSYRGRSCPILVHCSDGVGRTGTYCLIDMVLNRMAKGAKEIDIAATLEHIRDQRMCMVKTKEQFEFALAAVAEEVHAILKALPQ